jgi:hypothetical protein
MRGSHRNIALLLVLAATLVAGSAEARVGGNPAAAAAQRMGKAAQLRFNRMKQKMSLRPRGTMMQKTRRMLSLGRKRMVGAMSRRLNGVSRVQLLRAASRRTQAAGLGGKEAENTRARFARNLVDPAEMGPSPDMVKKDAHTNHVGEDNHEKVEKLARKQRKKMRVAAKKRAAKAFRNLRSRRGHND